MTDRNARADSEGGVALTRKVLEALPPLASEDAAIAAIVGGLLDASELMDGDELTER